MSQTMRFKAWRSRAVFAFKHRHPLLLTVHCFSVEYSLARHVGYSLDNRRRVLETTRALRSRLKYTQHEAVVGNVQRRRGCGGRLMDLLERSMAEQVDKAGATTTSGFRAERVRTTNVTIVDKRG